MSRRLDPRHHLSYSQLSEFLTCRHRWLLKYVYGIRPPEYSVALDIGSAFHEGIAGYFLTGDYRKALNDWYFKADAEWMLADIPHGYAQTAHDAAELIEIVIQDFNNRGYRVYREPMLRNEPLIEQQLSMPLIDGDFDTLYGFIDAFVTDQSGNLWVLDWKTRKTFKDDHAEEMNLQNSLYTALAHYNGYNVAGSITYQVASKPPAIPSLLAARGNGEPKMSRARIATTWEKYRECVIEAGLDPADYYEEMFPKLNVEFCRPLIAHRGPVQIQHTIEQIVIPAAVEMQRAYQAVPEHLPRIHNPLLCGTCSVRDVCLGTLRGYKTEITSGYP